MLQFDLILNTYDQKRTLKAKVYYGHLGFFDNWRLDVNRRPRYRASLWLLYSWLILLYNITLPSQAFREGDHMIAHAPCILQGFVLGRPVKVAVMLQDDRP